MSLTAENSAFMAATKSLCETMVSQPEFKSLFGSIESFLGDDASRLQYQQVHEMGDALNNKQRSGVELSDAEINEFETTREQLLKNSIVTEFMDAQRELQTVQQSVGKYVSLTLELGRVPTEEDFAAAAEKDGGGCCGGGGGGGCGC